MMIMRQPLLANAQRLSECWLKCPTLDCRPDVWGHSVPQFEGRQLGRLDAERRELLALII
jgi:hypothetical protein